MNAALGQGGVILGVAASLGGVATLAVALRQRRLHLIAVGRSYALLALLGAVVAPPAKNRNVGGSSRNWLVAVAPTCSRPIARIRRVSP